MTNIPTQPKIWRAHKPSGAYVLTWGQLVRRVEWLECTARKRSNRRFPCTGLPGDLATIASYTSLVNTPLWAIPMDIAPSFSGPASGLMNTDSALAAIVSPLVSFVEANANKGSRIPREQLAEVAHAIAVAGQETLTSCFSPAEVACVKRGRPITSVNPTPFDCLRSAVTGTPQHAKIRAPRTDCISILVGHHAGQLMHMSEIVYGPCRKKF